MLRRQVMLGSMLAALTCSCSPQAPPATAPTTAAPPAAAAAASTAPDPVAMVTVLYAPYLASKNTPDLLSAAPWTDDLRALLQKATTLSKDEVILDADPIVAAQEWQLSNLDVSQESPPAAGHAMVVAKFRNMTRDDAVHFDLVEIDGAWRVDNIRSADWNLRDNLVSGIAEVEKSAPPK